ncbi:hypothetical protein TWF679_007482 [Orbilia oligospora]|uniref:Uncharacterized protein n=1 Tax=Orbilia oligospora TaxID=2813651 RepID=A0A8H8V748_ORBOL|nr:hypothetical protein TWF679_007482 [Orbilia oligospora]
MGTGYQNESRNRYSGQFCWFVITRTPFASDSMGSAETLMEVDDVIRANLLGTIYGTKFYLKEMTRARRGCIINISSVLATTGGAGSSVYAASKSGLHGFVKSVAKEASRFNVRINNILPGYIETEMTAAIRSSTKAETLPKPPVGRFGTAAEIADAAYYLATNDYVTGTDLIVDGGYAIR